MNNTNPFLSKICNLFKYASLNQKIISFLLLLILFVTSCTTAAAPEYTPTPQLSLTHTLAPSTTPAPTNTPEPTLTPSATPLSGSTLNEEGQWLMYRHEDGSIYFTNPDGTGLTSLPYKIPFTDTSWMQYSSTNNHLFMLVENEPEWKDDQLAIISIPDMEVILKLDLYAYYQTVDVEESEWEAFIYIAPEWSPNGRYLAIPAVLDNTSIDLYVFDVITNKLQRLSWGENHVGKITWSPDSKWIVHEEVTHFVGWSVKAMWATAPDGSGNQWLYEPYNHANQRILGWINSQSFVSINSDSRGAGYARLTNVSTQESITLYEGYYGLDGPDFDPKNRVLAFHTVGNDPIPQEENGLYLLYLDNPYPIFFSKELILHEFETNYERFLTQNECENGDGYTAFNSKKEISCVDPFYFHSHELSPDRQWVLNLKTNELCSYPEEECIFRYAEENARTEWNPDSQGFYVSTNGTLQYIPVDTVTPIMINDRLEEYYKKYGIGFLQLIGK